MKDHKTLIQVIRGFTSRKGIKARAPWKLSTMMSMMLKTIQRTRVAITEPLLHALVWPLDCRAAISSRQCIIFHRRQIRRRCNCLSCVSAFRARSCFRNEHHHRCVGQENGRNLAHPTFRSEIPAGPCISTAWTRSWALEVRNWNHTGDEGQHTIAGYSGDGTNGNVCGPDCVEKQAGNSPVMIYMTV